MIIGYINAPYINIKRIVDPEKMTFEDIGECMVMLEPVTDEDCLIKEGNSVEVGWLEKYKDEIKDKWYHCAKDTDCRDCISRFSTVKLLRLMHYIAWRITVCEFIRAVSTTAQLTDLVCDPKKGISNKFVRTVFGVLSDKVRRTKKGFAFTIDLSAADRTKRSGAKFFAEMVGITAITTGGSQPTRFSMTTDSEGKVIH